MRGPEEPEGPLRGPFAEVRRGECLRAQREAPEIGERLPQPVAREQRKCSDRGGPVAELQRIGGRRVVLRRKQEPGERANPKQEIAAADRPLEAARRQGPGRTATPNHDRQRGDGCDRREDQRVERCVGGEGLHEAQSSAARRGPALQSQTRAG